MAEIASVTQRGKFEPFGLQVSRGQIAWHRAVTVFGYNPDVDTTEEVVWPDGSTVGGNTVAATLKISSSSTSDAAAGTGARTVLISGLDGSHNEISETVTLNGQTAVNTTKTYLHVNGITVLTVGSGGSNAGVIYAGTGVVTLGVPASIYNLIDTGFNQSTSAMFTIPSGYTGYVVNGGIGNGQGGGDNPVIGKLNIVDPTGISRVGAVNTLNNGFANYDFFLPLQIPTTYTVRATAIGIAPNNYVTAYFQLILIKNDGA